MASKAKGSYDIEEYPPEIVGNLSTEPEIVRWVARNISVPKPDPSECPDPFAWTLLRECRRSPEFTVWFTEKLWSKLIPSRSQLDTGTGDELDGKPTMDLLRKVEEIARKARGDKAPKPTKVPNAFEDFDPTEEA